MRDRDKDELLVYAVTMGLRVQCVKHGLNGPGQTVRDYVDDEVNKWTNANLLRAISAALPEVVRQLNAESQ